MSSTTPYGLYAVIDDFGTIGTSGNFISVTSFRYSLKINSVAEAVLSLNYNDEEGYEQLKELFPSESSNTYFNKVKVYLTDFKSPTSGLTKSGRRKIFEGNIVGYSPVAQVGNMSWELNLKGCLFNIQNIAIFSPGFHVTNPGSYAVEPLVYFPGNNTYIESLINSAKTKKNALDVFNDFVETYTEVMGVTTFKKEIHLYAYDAIKKGLASKVLIESNALKSGGNINLNIPVTTGITEKLLNQVLRMFIGNPTLTFWDFLIQLCVVYSLDAISNGKSIYIIPKCPLDKPVEVNYIFASDIAHNTITDFPYFIPTRCIVTSTELYTYQGQRGKQSVPLGEYPKTSDLTNEEKKLGVFAKVYEAPAFLYDILQKIEHRESLTDLSKLQFGVTGASIAASIATISAAGMGLPGVSAALSLGSMASGTGGTELSIYDMYAKYMLMQEKLKQRTGSLTTRFMPHLIPGFPATIESPLGVGELKCRIIGVEHVVSSQDEQALTTISFDNIRYGNEFETFPNPLYSSFNIESSAKEINNDMLSN